MPKEYCFVIKNKKPIWAFFIDCRMYNNHPTPKVIIYASNVSYSFSSAR